MSDEGLHDLADAVIKLRVELEEILSALERIEVLLQRVGWSLGVRPDGVG